MKQFILLFIFCSGSFFAFGQNYGTSYRNDAKKAFENGDYKSALEYYNASITTGASEDAEFKNKIVRYEELRSSADKSFNQGKNSEAIATYQELLKLNPSDTNAKKRIAECNPKRNQLDTDGSGNSVFMDGMKLERDDVKQVLEVNPHALQLYNKGLAKNRIGTVLLISGALVSGGGGFIVAKHPLDKKSFYRGRDGNTYYRYQNETLNDALGIGIIAAGAGMIIAGIVLKSNSPNDIKGAVNMYNGGKNRSSIEWKFDFSGNGVRLAVNF